MRCRAAAQKPSCEGMLWVAATRGTRGGKVAAALLLLLHLSGGIGPSCSCPLLIPHTPAPTEGFCPRQGWRCAPAIRMASPSSAASHLPVVPRGGSALLEEEAGLCRRRGGGHGDILRKPFVASQGSSASRVLKEQPGVSGHNVSGKNAPIVTGRGNSCLLGVMFGGMFGLKEMR